MSIVKTLIRSFASGIIGDELYGRLDLAKFQTGLKQALNFWTLPHGPVQNRPGFEYVLEAKDSATASRIIPFSYNTDQTFILEFGDLYVRWHSMGGTLLETGLAITGISQANPGVLTYAGADPANGDWFFLSGIGGMTQLNGRFVKVKNVNAGANTFELSDIHGGANINTTGYPAYTSGGTAARVYQLATPYTAADLFGLHFVQSADVLTIVHPNYEPRELRRLGATNWQLSVISFSPTIATPAAPGLGSANSGSATYTYVTTAIAADTQEESLQSPPGVLTLAQALTASGAVNYITPAAVAGAARHNIYKLKDGLFGFIGQTDGTFFSDTNITPDPSRTPPQQSAPFSGAGNYPGAVGYYEQRRCFAGTNNRPQNFWASRSGTESNLTYSIPSRDDDALAFRVVASEVNRIRHIMALDQLIMLTSGGEFRISPANSDILTPTSAQPKQFAAEGASNVQPVVTSSSIIYVQESGTWMREMQYKWEANGLRVTDISVMAPHLFDGYQIVDLAYAKTPYKFIWCVRSDGKLLGLTYLPEHDVIAWHEHETDGFFESVACVKEGAEHALYAVVRRTINSRTVRYIERLHTRRFTAQEDAFFVDSGATYDGAPISQIQNGLWHLEGKTLAVLADGAEVTGLTVTNGTVTLDYEASVIHLGLPITADIETLPLAFEAQALGQGLQKNVNEVYLRLKETSGIKVGPTFTDSEMVEMTMRSDEPYGTPPRLVTGVEQITIMPEWDQDATLCIRQNAPLPCTILSMVMEVSVGD